jgi:hypothetical protein
MPEEVLEDILMDDDELALLHNQHRQEGLLHQNIQLGLVRTFFSNKPQLPKQMAPNLQCWEKFFSPRGGNLTVEIPTKWIDFFQECSCLHLILLGQNIF